jgi:peptidoglycan/xylan/chitin deacetylase (PgdA/CDA1 family)
MTLLHEPRFSSWARGHLLCRVDEVAGVAALTFDDGPSTGATASILDLLAAHGARATFFTLAPNVERLPHLVRRMVDEGHEVALHGEIHWPLPVSTPWLIKRELARNAAAVERAAGVRARHYRPPFGFMAPSQARYVAGLGYLSVLGDVYPEDTHRPGVDAIVARVIGRLAAGSIVILHDGSPFGEADRAQTVAALERILVAMRGRGLRGVSVAGLLQAAPAAALEMERRLRGGPGRHPRDAGMPARTGSGTEGGTS